MDYKRLASKRLRKEMKAVVPSSKGRVTSQTMAQYERKTGDSLGDTSLASKGSRAKLVRSREYAVTGRLLSRLKTRDRIAARSPANKLARALIGKRSSTDVMMSNAAHKPLNTSGSTRRNPAVASHIARKAAEVMKAGTMMLRLESIKSGLYGPGGKKIK
jgi:hypothetical protein